MKKVISALTAAAMCASMSASVMTAFAAYSASDVTMYLKAVEAGKGTISEDGKTITFASAADAKGATIKIQNFIKADTENPNIAGFGFGAISSDKAITFDATKATAFMGTGSDATYTLTDGTEFTTSGFVHTFGKLAKVGKKYNYDAAASPSTAWADSSVWEWDYTGNPMILLKYSGALAETDTTITFIDSVSDKFPSAEFEATIGDIADGTYTIEYVETWENMKLPEAEQTQPGTYMMSFDAQQTRLAKSATNGLTIVVGDGSTEPSSEEPSSEEPSSEEPSSEDPQPSSEDPQPSSENPTSGETPESNIKDPASFDKETFYFDDIVYDISSDQAKEDGGVQMDLRVAKNEPTAGFEGALLINGKNPVDVLSGLSSVDYIYQDGGYGVGLQKNLSATEGCMFAGTLSGTTKETGEKTLADGSSVLSFWIDIDENTPTGTYTFTLADGFKLVNFDKEDRLPAIASGTLTIIDSSATQPSSEEPSSEEPSSEEPSSEEPSSENPTPSDYLYGDVNNNKKVELVDIVMLNRFLTGFGGQELDEYATVVANCYRANGESDADTKQSDLDGKDSMEILKHLIGLVKTLPTKA